MDDTFLIKMTHHSSLFSSPTTRLTAVYSVFRNRPHFGIRLCHSICQIINHCRACYKIDDDFEQIYRWLLIIAIFPEVFLSFFNVFCGYVTE